MLHSPPPPPGIQAPYLNYSMVLRKIFSYPGYSFRHETSIVFPVTGICVEKAGSHHENPHHEIQTVECVVEGNAFSGSRYQDCSRQQSEEKGNHVRGTSCSKEEEKAILHSDVQSLQLHICGIKHKYLL